MDEVRIVVRGNYFALTFPYNELLVAKAKGIPERRFDPKTKAWLFRPTLENLDYVTKWFSEATWSTETYKSIEKVREKQRQRAQTRIEKKGEVPEHTFHNVPFKLEPFNHQKMALYLGRDKESFAYLMDQGTGKTKVLIDDSAHNFRILNILGLLVIAPNSVKSNWVDPDDTYSKTGDPDDMDEVTKHMAPDVEVNKACWISSPTKNQKQLYGKAKKLWGNPNYLHILSINVEGLRYDAKEGVSRLHKECEEFIARNHRVMIAVDESTRIKNRMAKRTKSSMKLREKCVQARILTGTPIIKSPLDAFSQFKFLDEDILGYTSFQAFRNHFAIMGGFEGKQVVQYKNLDELSDLLDSASYRVLKQDCLDIPLKMPPVLRKIEMTGLQKKYYDQMRKEAIVFLENEEVISATIVLDQILKLQQIANGFLPLFNDEGETIGVQHIGNTNNKIIDAADIIEECQHKVVVWARFVPQVTMMVDELRRRGIECAPFYGDVKEADRVTYRKRFQKEDDPLQVIVGQTQTGGIGLDFWRARTMIYLSNSMSTEQRVQSEDRAHRFGQKFPVQYLDLYCPGTVEEKIIKMLNNDQAVSASILKDDWRNWI